LRIKAGTILELVPCFIPLNIQDQSLNAVRALSKTMDGGSMRHVVSSDLLLRTVMLSLTESEYIATSEAAMAIKHVKQVLDSMQVKIALSMTLRGDLMIKVLSICQIMKQLETDRNTWI